MQSATLHELSCGRCLGSLLWLGVGLALALGGLEGQVQLCRKVLEAAMALDGCSQVLPAPCLQLLPVGHCRHSLHPDTVKLEVYAVLLGLAHMYKL